MPATETWARVYRRTSEAIAHCHDVEVMIGRYRYRPEGVNEEYLLRVTDEIKCALMEITGALLELCSDELKLPVR